MKTFSIKNAVSFGFETVKKNFFFFLGVIAIVFAVSAVNSSLQENLVDQWFLYTLVSIVFWIIAEIVGMGVIRINLSFVDGKKPKFSDLFILNWRQLLNYILGSFLVGLTVLGGMILLIVPGIIFALKLQYTTYLIVDKNIGPIEAYKKSWQMTKGQVWHLFLLALTFIGINLVGLLLLVVGLLFSAPLSMVAATSVYRKLSS